jgi:TolB protein
MKRILNSQGKAALAGLLLTAASPAGSRALGGGARHASPARTFAPAAAVQLPAAPCDTGKIAFQSNRSGSNVDIFVMNSDGTGVTMLTNSTGIDVAPAFSPDGSLIAFQSNRDDPVRSQPDIYVMNADGTNVRRLTTDPEADEAPEWSPDGTKIAFVSARADPVNQNRDLYVMNADGSGTQRLTFGSSLQPRISWSPDGTRIVFASRFDSDHNRLLIIGAGGGTAVPLTTPPVSRSDAGPDWSPDGSLIAFGRLSFVIGEATDIFVVRPDGSGLKNLTNAPGHDFAPAWSSDGSVLAFTSTRDGNAEVYWMYPDGSGQTNLTNLAAFDDGPSWQAPQSSAPCLLTEPGTERSVALTSVTFTRDPFAVTTPHNLSPDQRTRVMLFFRNLKLAPDDQTTITAQAEDAQNRLHNLVIEFVGKVPGFDWLGQVVVILPPELQGAGDVRVSIRVSGGQSNKALVNIAPGGTP